jgi:hypothetical protein
MSVDKHVEIGDEFDALLRKELSIEPSTGFLPRVRERIAAAPMRGWDLRWLMAAGAAAMCVMAIASGSIGRLGPAPPAVPPQPSVILRAAEVVTSAVPRPVKRPPLRRRVVQSSPPVAATHRHGSPHVEPPLEVLVDQRQRAALATLVEMLRTGRITDKAFARTIPPSLDAIREQVVPVEVLPVSVSSLGVDGVLQKGTGQN